MNVKPYAKALMIFRRDLRLEDNTALVAACKLAHKIIPCFIFDPLQIKPHKWQSLPGLQFMLNALLSLDKELTRHNSGLLILSGSPEQVLAKLITEQAIDAVFLNRDYTPFARERDFKLAQLCERLNITFHSYDDALITPPDSVLTHAGTPYKVFTAFYRSAIKMGILPIQKLPEHFKLAALSEKERQHTTKLILQLKTDDDTYHIPTLEETLSKLESLSEYAEQRDFPGLDATSHLSVHLKFGSISVREVYYLIGQLLGQEHSLIRQLYWRDFFSHIAWHFPHVFGQNFDSRFNSIVWNRDETMFNDWCEGKTGFPIVDAGMRELKQSGFMHNRVRMICASFLVKDCHISWRWGESWFARHLMDYDPALNNGNWQWAASTGCDAQPWFRIFNPWLQQKRFDPDCAYIKHWIPQLRNFESRIIHQWWSLGDANSHPLPIVDHKIASAYSKEMFRFAIERGHL